jgi:hypothetical protein
MAYARARAFLTREGIGPDRSYWVRGVGRMDAVEFPAGY